MGATQCCQMESAKAQRSAEEGDAPLSAHQAKSPENSETPLKSALKVKKGAEVLSRMKDTVSKHMNTVRDFRSFLKKHFKSSTDAWDVIAADLAEGELVQQAVFLTKVQEMGFDGDAGSIFNTLNEDGDGIGKEHFKKFLARKTPGFIEVVQEAVEKSKEEKAKGKDGKASQDEKDNSSKTSPGEEEREKSTSPRESKKSGRRGSRDATDKKRDSSPKPSDARRSSKGSTGTTATRDSSPKETRPRRASRDQGEPAGEASRPRRASRGDVAAGEPIAISKMTSKESTYSEPNKEAKRGSSTGSLASLSTAASAPNSSPSGSQAKRKSV